MAGLWAAFNTVMKKSIIACEQKEGEELRLPWEPLALLDLYDYEQ